MCLQNCKSALATSIGYSFDELLELFLTILFFNGLVVTLMEVLGETHLNAILGLFNY